MNILIIEDEPATAQRLRKLLGEVAPELHVIREIDTVEESISYFGTHTYPDLVFMDIHLADGNSFEIFEKVDIRCPIIFTTAYDEYAIKAFKVNSIDYLLKPIKKEDLVRALNKFRQSNISSRDPIPEYSRLSRLLDQNQKEYLKRFMVKTGQQIKVINIADVAYFYVENKMVFSITKKGQRHLIDYTMDHLEQYLNPDNFFRVNRSFIIGFDAIDSMVAYSKSRIKVMVIPPCEAEIISSGERTAAFKRWLMGK